MKARKWTNGIPAALTALALMAASAGTAVAQFLPPPPAPTMPAPPPPNSEPMTVSLPTPQELLARLQSTVDETAFKNKGLKNSFSTKVDAARGALAGEDTAAAVAALEDFVSHAKAQSGKGVGSSEASDMISQAQAIIARLAG